jgi:hypothetical protein
MLDVILISICVCSFPRLHMLQAYALDLEWYSLLLKRLKLAFVTLLIQLELDLESLR